MEYEKLPNQKANILNSKSVKVSISRILILAKNSAQPRDAVKKILYNKIKQINYTIKNPEFKTDNNGCIEYTFLEEYIYLEI